MLVIARSWQTGPPALALADGFGEPAGVDVFDRVAFADQLHADAVLARGAEVRQPELFLVGVEVALKDLVAPGGGGRVLDRGNPDMLARVVDVVGHQDWECRGGSDDHSVAVVGRWHREQRSAYLTVRDGVAEGLSVLCCVHLSSRLRFSAL